LATIEYIEEHKLVENSAVLGDYLLAQLALLQEAYPIIGHVAGKGLHIGVDLVKNRKTKERAIKEAETIMYLCMQDGVAFKIIEGNVITMRPALVIDKGHCDMIISTLKKALDKVSVP